MKITDVEALQLRLPSVEEIADGTQDVLVIRIHTDAGLTGIGEVSSQSYVCKAIFEAPRSAERRHGLAHILRGQDPMDVEGLWRLMYHQTSRYGMRGAAIHAISGADLALWDLRGKALGKPVHELLGGTYRKTVRAYASYLFGSTPQATAKLGREALDLGLSAMKFGWGPFGADLANDVAHVESARHAIGDRCDLMVDAGQKLNVESSLQRADLFAPLRIAWLEEPLLPDDRAGYANLCPRSPVPIAGGELDVTPNGFEDLIATGMHVIQPDVAICGGLTVAREASRMAEAAGRRCVPHCFSTGINLAASLHWMASCAHGELVEYCLQSSPFMRSLVRNLPPLIDGRVPIPEGPGLGIELDETIISQYRVS
jgi:L-rhamnonate dehydratase